MGQTTVHPQHSASVVISNEFKNLAATERVQFHDVDVQVEISPAPVAQKAKTHPQAEEHTAH